jgi:hypothetical protein
MVTMHAIKKSVLFLQKAVRFSIGSEPYNAGDICRKTGRILNSQSEYFNNSVKTG